MVKLIGMSLLTSSLLLFSGCGNKNHDSKSLNNVFKDESLSASQKLIEKNGEVRIETSTVSLEQKKKITTILDELSAIDGRMYFYEGADIEVGGIKNLRVNSFEALNNVLKSITNYEIVITKNKLLKDLPKVVELRELKESSVLDELQVGQNSLVLPSKLLSSISSYADGWKIDYKNDLKLAINNSDVIDFNGSARDFIDFYAKTNNLFVDWDYKRKIITFSKYKQKILRLQTSNEKHKFSNNIEVDLNNESSSGSSGGSSSGGGGSKSTGVELTSSYDIMENFKLLVKTIIPQNTADEYINVIEDTGHIAVSTTPIKLEQLEEIIKKLNGDAHKQVSIKVTLIETDLSNQYQNGVNWSFVKDTINGQIGKSIVAGINSQVATPEATLNAGNFLKFKNANTGVGAIVKLLNTFGDTAVSFQNSGITTNNLPIIYNISNTKGYVSEFKLEGVGDNVTVAPTQDSVTGGAYLYVKPSMVEDKITLSVKMVTSRINPFIRQEFLNGQYIQSKDVDKKLFSQNIVMKSGERIIIGGIIQKTVQSSYEGLSPNQNFFGSSLLGVKDKAYQTKEIAVMLEVEEI